MCSSFLLPLEAICYFAAEIFLAMIRSSFAMSAFAILPGIKFGVHGTCTTDAVSLEA